MLTEPVSLLHFAPEPALSTLLRPIGTLDYTSGDLDPASADEVMDITAIPRPESSFDVVLCNHVLEHVPNDWMAISELFRVLKPGGVAYMQHPIDLGRNETYEDPAVSAPEDRLREFGQEDHVRWYGVDHADRLRSAGFEVEIRRYDLEVGSEEVRRYSIKDGPTDGVRGSDIHVCRRPTNGRS